MDGKAVTKALAAVIRPRLREEGFSRFAGRHAWRVGEKWGRIDLVTFPSFSGYVLKARALRDLLES